MRILLVTPLVLIVLYLAFVAALYLTQRDHIYLPASNPPNRAELTAHELTAQDITVTPEENLSLHGWYFPPTPENGRVILLFHGNSGDISGRVFKAAPFLAQGYGVLLAEYRGYGGNPGKPTEAGLYKDAQAYYDWLIENGTKPENIILYGESLGSGVAVEMAARNGAHALILEVPYASLLEIGRRNYFFIPFLEYLMTDQFRSDLKISTLTMPKLFLIAGQDTVIGAQTGINLYEMAPAPKTLKVFDEAPHNGVYDFDAQAIILHFLKSLETGK
ncbi:MAG: alpha/beta hydrolase [Alphaproteobacteria bacterium]|nr:alpha/beta hydrolase [Alphaproteobacteria bacterium]